MNELYFAMGVAIAILFDELLHWWKVMQCKKDLMRSAVARRII